MTAFRRRASRFIAVIFTLLLPTIASAATAEFRVLLDIDNNPATGCAANGLTGVEQILVTRVEVNETESHVTEVHRLVCTPGSLGSSFGPPTGVDPTDYPAGGPGTTTVETRIAYSDLTADGGMPTGMRVGFAGQNGTATQTILVDQHGAPIIFPDPTPGKRRAIGVGGTRHITLDGQHTADWGAIEPLAPGSASGGSSALRIINVYGVGDGMAFYFRFDVIADPEDNEAPTDITLAPTIVAENEPAGTIVGTFTTADPNDGDTHQYSLVPGTGDGDNALFTITPGGDLLRTAVSFDFEAGSTYSIRVRTTDSGGLTFEKAFTIAITNANDAPTDIALSNDTTQENEPAGTTIGTFSSTDQDAGETFTYALVAGTGGTDNASFQIVGNQLQNAAILDFDTQSSYSIRVRTTDSGGLTFDEVFTITVTNVNEAPTDLALAPSSVDENQPAATAVGTFSTTDPDAGDTFTYTLVAGTGSTDNASFTIVGNQLRTAASFDFETKNSYSIRVRTTDAGGLFYEEQVTIAVNNVNETPADIALSASTVAENQPAGTAVGTFTTTDIDAGDTHTYSLVAGAGSTDNASFTIAGNQLQTAASFDFETKNSYSIRVRTTDAGGLTYEEVFTITVTDANDTPTDMALSNASTPENQPVGTMIGTFSTTDQDAGDTFTYTLVAGAGSTDNGSFQISGNQLQNAVNLDFEAQATYSVRVRTTDAGGLFYEEVFVISVTNVNETPTDMALSGSTVAENAAAGTTVGTLSTVDPDAGDTFTYSLVAGAGDTGNASFQIVGNELRTSATFDFETQSSYSVRLRTTDAGGLFYEEQFTITVTNVNEAPVDMALSASTVAENQPSGTAVGNFTTTDVDAGDTHTYTLVAGAGDADNASFTIVGNQLRTAASFDFETKSSYSIRVRTTDAGGLTYEEVFTITVTDTNEAPTAINLSNNTVDENLSAGSTVGTLSSVDVDAGDTFTYTLVAGAGSTDNASFAIVGDQLQTAAIFNFEVKSSYSIRVRSTDSGGLFFEQQLTINVNDVNDAPTDLALGTTSVDENQPSGTTVGALTTTDEDAGDTHTYTLVAGAGDTDNASFSISGSNLLTAASFDFETKSSYSVRIRTTDAGGLFYEEQVTITVNDVNEAPTDAALSAASVDENQPSGTAVGTFSTTDVDAGDTHTYTLVAGAGDADNASFSISGNQLLTAASFDFETKSSYTIRIRTTDAGGLFYEEAFTITVTDVNDAPTDMALSNATAPENQAVGTTIGTLSTTDQDAGDTFTYTLVAGTGSTDNASFQITGNQLQNAVNLDFEAQTSYSVRIRTTDAGGLFYEEVFTITVTNVNEAPTDLALSPAAVDENQPAGTTVGALTSTDVDAGDTFTYTLVAGAGDTDNASFSISGSNLLTAASFDFETKASYSVRIRTTDAGGLFYEEQVTIAVGDVNEAPTDITLSASAVAENQASGTAVGTFSTTDVDAGDTHTYTLVAGAGDTGNGSFAIVGNQLQTAASFDFEAQPSYSIRVRTTDAGGLFYEEVFTINVTNANEAPTDMALSNATAPENQAVGTSIGTLTTTDIDAGDTFTYTLVAGAGSTDNASFQITGDQLQNAVNLDFEAQTSYSVRIRTTDAGGLFYEEVFTITVTNVNEAPTDLALSPSSVDEDEPIGTTVGALTSTDPDAGDTFTYTLVAGAGDTDNASFSISGSNVLTAAVFDFETDSSYSVRIRTTDAGGLFYEEQVTITINNVNDAPTDIALSAATVQENQPAGTVVGTFTTTDVDPGDTHTYTLVAGAGDTNNGSFTIVGDQLQTTASFDFETQPSLSIRVRTTDSGGLTYEEVFTITVTNANETPTDMALSNATAPENQAVGTSIGTLTTTDVDAGDTFTYTLVAGAGSTDNASFQITGDQLQNAVNLDFDTQSSYSVRIRTTDAGGLFYEEVFTITVTNVNEAPTDLAVTPSSVDEDEPIGTTVGALTSTDPDAGDTFTYTLVAGAGDTDNASFSISGSNLLTAAVFDFETDSSYSVRIRTTDAGGLFYEEQVTITINNVNDPPTDIALSVATVQENQPSGTAVGTFTTTDIDPGDTHTYSLVAGAGDTGNGSFTIVGNQLQTAASFDFETQPSFSIRVRTTDSGGLTYEEVFTITVTNANETPTDIALSNATTAENQAPGTPIGTFTSTDPDAGDTFTYTLVAGTGDTDNASFQIVGDQLQNAVNLNFEAQSSYTIRVRTTDAGGLFYEEAFTITVTDANDAPTALGLTPQNINENQPSGTTVGTFSTTDQEAQTYTYTLVAGAGDTDNASFTISGDQLLTAAVFDFETKPSYAIRVRTTDSGVPSLFFEQTFTISVNNVNETPTDITLTPMTIAENAGPNAPVGTLAAVDPDAGDTFTFTLVAGTGDADNAAFAIVGNQLQAVASFDFETDNSYSVRIRATDAGGLFYEEAITITVTNVNEVPTDITLSANSINENNAVNAVIGTLTTTDVDVPDTHTYTLVAGTGDTDNASFNILGNDLRASIAFNFEAKSSYTVRIRTTDAGGLFYEEAFTITIINVNEAPTAATDAFNYISNTELRVDGHAGTANAIAHTTTTVNPLDNDTDPDSPFAPFSTLTITAVTNGTTANNGVYDIASDGTIRYTPPAGFTGTDSVTYQLSDGTNNVNGTINFTMTGTLRVWYVKNNDPTADGTANRDGTSSYPFNTLGSPGAQAASGVNDTIYVDLGNGTSSGQNSGFVMKNGQKLHGKGVGLTFDPDGGGVILPVSLIAAGSHSVIGNSAGNAVSATNLSNLEVRGLSISATGGDAINMVVNGANNGGITIDTNIVTAATNEGLDLDHTSTGSTTVSLHDNTWTTTGNSIDINKTAGTLTITAFDDNSVSGNTGGAGIVVTGAVFDATAGGAYQTVSGGNTSIGVSGNPVGTSGMLLTTVTGDLSFTGLQIFASAGTGLFASSSGVFNAATPTGFRLVSANSTEVIEATGGPAVNFSGLTTTLQTSSIRSINSATTGVSFDTVAGAFSAGSGSNISGATGTSFNVNASSLNTTYDGPISTSTGGRGVSLTTNTGTYTFTGNLTFSTGANPAFTATSSGTVSANNASSTITTTTGVAVNIANTTIAAAGVQFATINTTGVAANGVILNTTGAGGFTVNGGTISNKTSHAFALTSASNVTLSGMTISNNLGSGVHGLVLTALTMTNCTVNNNADSTGGSEAGLFFTNLLGTSTLTNTSVTNSAEDNIRWSPSSGTGTLNITGGTIGPNDAGTGAAGINMIGTGTANVTLNVTGGTIFTGNKTAAVNTSFTDTSAHTINVTGSTFTSNFEHVNMAVSSSADLTFDINGNTMTGATDQAISLGSGGSATNAALITGKIRNNNVGNGTVDSGSSLSRALDVDIQGDGVGTVSVLNNNFRNTDIEPFRAQARLDDDADAQTASLSLTVRDNTFGLPDDNSAFPFFTLYGMLIEARNTSTVCLDITGNTSNGLGGLEDIRVRQRDTATMRIERLTDGDGTPNETLNNAATIEGHISAENDAGTSVDATFVTGMVEAANGACPEG